MVIAELEIVNEHGMHARPSASFAKIATKYKSHVYVEKNGEVVNGKSILGLMMLAAENGSHIKVTADGPDAQETINELTELVESGFTREFRFGT
jgi:phosphocarrier protein